MLPSLSISSRVFGILSTPKRISDTPKDETSSILKATAPKSYWASPAKYSECISPKFKLFCKETNAAGFQYTELMPETDATVELDMPNERAPTPIDKNSFEYFGATCAFA